MSARLRLIGWLTVIAAIVLAAFAADGDNWIVFVVAVLCGATVATVASR